MDEEYRGDATIGDKVVTVRLSARLEPLEGRYRWGGRAAPDEALTELLRSGVRQVTLRIGEREVPARLGEPDAWGGVRITGVGHPPWSSAADGE
jgi:hypothetical protein